MLKIKKDRNLWNNWAMLTHKLKNIAEIAQNDITLSEKDFTIWLKEYAKFKNDLREIYKDTLRHVERS